MRLPQSLVSLLIAGLTLMASCQDVVSDLSVSHHVHYLPNGGTGSVPVDSQGYSKDSIVVVAPKPLDLLRPGWSFVGWNSEGSGLGQNFQPGDKINSIAQDVSLYAKWTEDLYAVDFDSNLGSSVASQSLKYGQLVWLPAEPTRPGYRFIGWSADALGLRAWTFSSDKVTGPTTLYAQWTVQTRTVSFDSHGGSSVLSIGADDGTTIVGPLPPQRTNYDFLGWYRDATLSVAWTFSSDVVTSDLTLHAKWSLKTLSVAFDSQGGTAVTAQVVSFGSPVVKPVDPSRPGYSFANWFRDVSGTQAWDFASDFVTATMTLFAKWTSIDHTVSFNSQGGSAISSVVVHEGALMSEPSRPSRSGYSFVGWFKESGCLNPWAFASDPVAGDLTLFAKWTLGFSENGPDTTFALQSGVVSVAGADQTHYYHLRVPSAYNADKSKAYPLVVYLHPWGGDPTPSKLKDGAAWAPAPALALATSSTHPAFVYVPVCPPPFISNISDPAYEWNSPAARAMVVATIVDLSARFNIDPSRIYVMGFSMGGAGSWYLSYEYYRATGSRIAAVSRGSGWYLSDKVTPHDSAATILSIQNAMSLVPTWIHVGELDTKGFTVASDNFGDLQSRFAAGSAIMTTRNVGGLLSSGAAASSTLTQQTLTTGVETRLEVYAGRGHEDLMWQNTDLLDWIFAQHL